MYYVHWGLLVPLLLTLPDFVFFFFSSWNWASWRKTKSGVPLANLQATSPAKSIHLWFVLQEKSNQQRYPELPFDLNKSLPYFFLSLAFVVIYCGNTASIICYCYYFIPCMLFKCILQYFWNTCEFWVICIVMWKRGKESWLIRQFCFQHSLLKMTASFFFCDQASKNKNKTLFCPQSCMTTA